MGPLRYCRYSLFSRKQVLLTKIRNGCRRSFNGRFSRTSLALDEPLRSNLFSSQGVANLTIKTQTHSKSIFMMPSNFYFRNKVPVAVFQATEPLGQSYVTSLSTHPWLDVCEIFAQDDLAGFTFGSSLSAEEGSKFDDKIKQLKFKKYSETPQSAILLDGLAGQIKQLNVPSIKPGVFLLTPHLYLDPEIPLIIPEINGRSLDSISKTVLKTVIYAPDWIRDLGLIAEFLKQWLKASQLTMHHSADINVLNAWRKIITPPDMAIDDLFHSEMPSDEIELIFSSSRKISQEEFFKEYSSFLFQKEDYTYVAARKKYENEAVQMINVKDFQKFAEKCHLRIVCRESYLDSGRYLVEYLIKNGKVFW